MDMTVQQTNEPAYVIMDDEETGRRAGCSGCMWGLGGALGCLGFLTLPIVFAVILGLTTVNSIVQGITYVLNPGEPVYELSATIVLERIQEMSQLTTTRYNYSSIVTSEREMPDILKGLYGEQMVMVAVGHIVAGIDLSQLTEQSVIVQEGRVTIQLPSPVLQDCFLNESQSYVVSQDTGLFAAPSPNLDTESRRYAIAQFRDMSLEEGILDQAQTQAISAIEGLLLLILPEETELNILPTSPDQNAPLPESCQ